jgi:hypothetical protein
LWYYFCGQGSHFVLNQWGNTDSILLKVYKPMQHVAVALIQEKNGGLVAKHIENSFLFEKYFQLEFISIYYLLIWA